MVSPYQTAFRANAVNLVVGLLCVFDPKLASELKTFLHLPEISTLAKSQMFVGVPFIMIHDDHV